jgi:hypothetical protein
MSSISRKLVEGIFPVTLAQFKHFGRCRLPDDYNADQRLFKPNEQGVRGWVYQRLANRCLGAGPVPRKPLEG